MAVKRNHFKRLYYDRLSLFQQAYSCARDVTGGLEGTRHGCRVNAGKENIKSVRFHNSRNVEQDSAREFNYYFFCNLSLLWQWLPLLLKFFCSNFLAACSLRTYGEFSRRSLRFKIARKLTVR